MKRIVEFFKKNPWALVLLMLGVTGLIMYLIGKNRGRTQQFAKPKQGPTGETFNPGPYTDKAATEFDAWAWNFDGTIFAEILALPDWKIIAIIEDWQKRFAGEFSGRTFSQQLATEKDYSLFGSPWATTRDNLISKINQLGYQ